MNALMMNPRRRRVTRRRRRSYGRRPVRRRRNPGVLEIVNPRRRSYRNPRFGGGGGAGLQGLLTDGVMIALGGVLGNMIPAKLLKIDATATTGKRAMAAVGTGVVLGMMGRKFLPGNMARNLALGAVAAGAGMFATKWTGTAGLGSFGLGKELTDAEIDREISSLVSGPGYGVGTVEEFDVGTLR